MCLDENCSKFEIVYDTEKEFFYDHLIKKPRTVLIDIVLRYFILPEPYYESKSTLVNEIIEFSQKYVANPKADEVDQVDDYKDKLDHWVI